MLIHNWSLQPFKQDYWPSFSHHLCCVCKNLIHKWRDLQYKVDSEWQIFEKLFVANLFTLRVFARNLLRGNRRRNTFCILFWCLAWGSIPSFSSNKPTRYLLDHGDFYLLIQNLNVLDFNKFPMEFYVEVDFIKCGKFRWYALRPYCSIFIWSRNWSYLTAGDVVGMFDNERIKFQNLCE